MGYTWDDFYRDYAEEWVQERPGEKLLKIFPLEELLEAIPREELLKTLSTEERLRGLTRQEIEAYLEKLIDESH